MLKSKSLNHFYENSYGMIRLFTSFSVFCVLICSCFIVDLTAQGLQLPPDFYDELLPGEWNTPVGIHFDDRGRGYIWEKRGIVYLLDEETGALAEEPLIDLTEEVGSWGDHGLLGFALHPGFEVNGYFYLLYVVDRHHYLSFGTPDYDPSITLTHDATIGRVTRFQADPNQDFKKVVAGSRKVILGKGASDGIPILMASHGVGSLVFGEDGTLLVSTGEAGSFQTFDAGSAEDTYFIKAMEEGIIRPADNVGSYRSQMVNNLSGKILRIDPETGEGLPSNPYYDKDAPNAAQSKVWALGFRNPYRMRHVPETGSHYAEDGQPGIFIVCDVGSARYEELNIVVEPGGNYGWPIAEGMENSFAFWNRQRPNRDAPNPLFGVDGCEEEFFNFHQLFDRDYRDTSIIFQNPCDTRKTIPTDIPTFLHKRPALAWSGLLWNPPPRAFVPGYVPNRKKPKAISITGVEEGEYIGDDFTGYTGIPGFFYQQDVFPEEYQGTYFLADLSGWMRTIRFDDDYHVIGIDTFALWEERGIVDFALNPNDGCIYWLDVYKNEVHKICFGGDPSPVAMINADKNYGLSPLTVSFDGSASFDPNGSFIEYLWDFGDGESSREMSPQHTFTAANNNPQSFEATLTVTDSLGQASTKTVLISLNNTPPEVAISSFKDKDYYAVSGLTLLPLEAEVSDAEHQEEELSYEWQLFLHHNTHFHPEEPIEAKSTLALIDPIGCGPETFWYRIKLTVTDASGLQGVDEAEIFPYCGPAFFEMNDLAGEILGNKIQLNWSTNMEENLSHFEIQRTTDYRFETIDRVEANGNTTGFSAYLYEDKKPERGRLFYRLKTYNKEGAYEFSNTVVFEYPKPPSIYMYPNPAKDEIFLFIKEALTEEVQIEVFDTQGQLLYRNDWSATPGTNFNQEIPVRNLPSGLYYYKVIQGEEETVEKFVISKR